MQFSSIQKKGCKCGKDRCYPDISYEGWNHNCAPQEVLDRLEAKKKRKNAIKTDLTKLRTIAKTEEGVKPPKGFKSKSELLQEADRLFANFIKNRDKDKNGQATCPCCGKDVLVEVNGKFNPDCNILHFVDRDVYSLRFDEDNAAAGHSWCNRNQHFSPKGIEYQNFRNHLVSKFGEAAIAEMEVQHRKINRIEESQLKTIIEHYQN